MFIDLPLAKKPFSVLINVDDIVYVLPHRKGCRVVLSNKTFISRIDYDMIYAYIFYRNEENI